MRIIKITSLHLKRLLKNKSVLILTLLMPVIAMCIVTFFTNGKSSSTNSVYVDFVNYDSGQFGSQLIKDFNNDTNYNVSILNEVEAKQRVQHDTITAAVIIPKNFTESLKNNVSPNVKILKLNTGNSSFLIENKINSFITNNIIADSVAKTINNETVNSDVNINVVNSALIKEIKTNKIQVNSKLISTDNSNSLLAQFSVNLPISFMMFTIIYISLEITERKEDRTLRRMLSSPNSNLLIVGSFILTFLIIGWLQVILMLGTSALLFKVKWGSSLPALFILFTVLILVILGMGLLLCRFVKSASKVSAVANLITQVTCLLGGSYMPVQYFPDFLKKISYFMPQSWAVDAMSRIVIKNQGVSAILPDVGILLLFAAAFYTAGASTLKGIARE